MRLGLRLERGGRTRTPLSALHRNVKHPPTIDKQRYHAGEGSLPARIVDACGGR